MRTALSFLFLPAVLAAIVVHPHLELAPRRLPPRASCPYCKEAPALPTLSEALGGGVLRCFGSAAVGVAGGGAAHAALQTYAPIQNEFIDGLVNAFSLAGAGGVGALIGALWAIEAAIVASGLITVAFQEASRAVVDSKQDELAGARALETIRSTLQGLRERPGLQGFVIGIALGLCGLYDDPAVERLAAEAEAARGRPAGGATRTFSELLGLAVEATWVRVRVKG